MIAEETINTGMKKRTYKPTFLYVKIHNRTGLKYFGKTIRKNPVKYKGSGTYWMRHLIEHGNDVTTILLNKGQPYEDESTMKHVAVCFSKKHNIVKALDVNGRKIWANLVDEQGEGSSQAGNPKWRKSNQAYMTGPNNPSKKYGSPTKGTKRPGVGGRGKGGSWTEKERASQEKTRSSQEYKDKMAKVFADSERNRKISDSQCGRPGTSTGTKWYTDGKVRRQFKPGEELPGFRPGRPGVNPNKKGMRWYNNGEVNKQFRDGEVPDEFKHGRIGNKKQSKSTSSD